MAETVPGHKRPCPPPACSLRQQTLSPKPLRQLCSRASNRRTHPPHSDGADADARAGSRVLGGGVFCRQARLCRRGSVRCWSVAGPTLRLASLCRLLSLRNPFMDYNRHFKMYHGAIWAITSTDLRPRRTLSLTLQPSLSNVPLFDLGRNACTQCCAPAPRNVWWCPPSYARAD